MVITLRKVLLFCISLLVSFSLVADPLPLTCRKIPHHSDKLCFIITRGALGPFDDAAIYRLDSRGNWTLLHAYKDDVSTFNGLGFSSNGGLMWISWAEEGHPTLSFFRTNDYLNGEEKALGVLDEYGFDGLIKLSNQGKVIYTVLQDDGKPCRNGKRVHKDICEKILQLKRQP